VKKNLLMQDKLQLIFKGSNEVKKNNQIEQIVKKIEKIKKLENDKKKLGQKLKLIQEVFESDFKVLKPKVQEVYLDFFKLMIEKYNLKNFAKWEKDIIENKINNSYDYLNDINCVTDDISNLYNEFNVKLLSKLSDSEKKIRNEIAKNFFEDMGMEFEDDFDFNSMFNSNNQQKEKFFEKFQEHIHEQKTEEQAAEKKQIVKDTDIDFKDLYKKLAKLLHPDLSKTEYERVEKEKIMQELTNYWNERNYYELIMIWMEHDVENTCNLQINEKNQKNIINQLNEKMGLINSELYNIKKSYTDTAFYYQFNASNIQSIHKKIRPFLQEIEETTNETIKDIENFKNTKDFKSFLLSIKKFNEDRFDNFNNLNFINFKSFDFE
jgi:hypothetical protein